MAADAAVRLHRPALDRFLADLRGSAAAGEPHPLPRWPGASRPDGDQRGSPGGCAKSCAGCATASTSTRTCSTARSISARTRQSAAHGASGRHPALRLDPDSSVLDLDCRAHASTTSTSPMRASSLDRRREPTLTIIANALRVADGIAARLLAHRPGYRIRDDALGCCAALAFPQTGSHRSGRCLRRSNHGGEPLTTNRNGRGRVA